jgi:hypothetical protein
VSPIVEQVPDSLIFDTDQPCSLAQLQALYAAGFRGGVRTVTFSPELDPSDLTAREVQDFMAAGLGLMLYQRVREPGWLPSAALGADDAVVFITKANGAGYLAGASAWGDLEGIGGDAVATIAYSNAKSVRLKTAGRPPGEYVGDDVPLTGDQLFTDLIVPTYWRSLSVVPDVTTRGYQMVQIATNVSIAGVFLGGAAALGIGQGVASAIEKNRSGTEKLP